MIRELTSLRSEEQTTTSFFLFIRPRILRDSQFRDLQFLSDLETQDAQLPADYPVSRPLLVPCPTPAGLDPIGSEHLLPPMHQSDPMDEYEVIGQPQVVYPSP